MTITTRQIMILPLLLRPSLLIMMTLVPSSLPFLHTTLPGCHTRTPISFLTPQRPWGGPLPSVCRHGPPLTMVKDGAAMSADDGEALQALFSQVCDGDGLMSKTDFVGLSVIAQLLNDEDLLMEELDEFWAAAPKFPDMNAVERIDVDSFIQIYRDIDDLFEEDNDNEEAPTAATNGNGKAVVSPDVEMEGSSVTSPQEGNEKGSGEMVSNEGGKEGDGGVPDDVLESIFSKECDGDGLMTKGCLTNIPIIVQLLSDGDLLPEELDEIWAAAPKFPDVNAPKDERIDIDSFIKIYRDIDDLFEEDEDEEDDITSTASLAESSSTISDNSPPVSDAVTDEDDTDVEKDENELILAFRTLCPDGDAGVVSKTSLREWNEVKQLLTDDMLSESEFDELWDQTAKRPGQMGEMGLDVEGFLSFNVALDELFVFEDEEEGDEEDVVIPKEEPIIAEEELIGAAKEEPVAVLQETIAPVEEEPPAVIAEATPPMDVIEEEDLEPAELFQRLSNGGNTISLHILRKRWGELSDMISEGDLGEDELDTLYQQYADPSLQLTQEGFQSLYKAIDDLFEVDDDSGTVTTSTPPPDARSTLLSLLDTIATDAQQPSSDDKPPLPCGLDSPDATRDCILNVVSQVENQKSNMLLTRRVGEEDLKGRWELLYTSSGMMVFNKGLSGLGGTFPNGRFGGLIQTLRATKFTADVEYTERIETGTSSPDETSSFDVTVTGTWELKNGQSLLTGSPTVIMAVEPDRVTYGPTNTRADHWKSVRSMNLLDVTYLDEELRIMRGCTSTETLFIFRRI